ncbi:MAG: hypothetical protein HOQ24_04830 [Mycobacteriaceae bacterium]|nr:hypothetical protein [Mycobacteriaceae bacterium]
MLHPAALTLGRWLMTSFSTEYPVTAPVPLSEATFEANARIRPKAAFALNPELSRQVKGSARGGCYRCRGGLRGIVCPGWD